MKKMKTSLCAIVAATCLLSAVQPAFAAWEVIETTYNADGSIATQTFVFTNGGEKFDPDKLTWAQVPQWKIDLINAQELKPRTTGHQELDNLIKERLERVISDDMTNFQKLKAIYNDIVANCTYTIPIYSTQDGYDTGNVNPPKTYLMSYKDCEYAKYLLKNNAGVCDEFTAAFVAMANAIGFEAYDMAGWINGSGHAWALLHMNGGLYIFDPQAEQVNIKSNHVGYINFALPMNATNAYKAVDGCLDEQWNYRTTGGGISPSFITSDAQAQAIRDELIAYGESLGMTYSSSATSRFWESRASKFTSEADLLPKFKDHMKDMSTWYRATGYFNIVVEPTQNGDGDYLIHIWE